jgi:RHS repeat-associated protein
MIDVTLTSSDQYFGSRRVAVLDQLGSGGNSTFSQGTYYPWGEVKGATNPQNAWSFATYWQDSASGLDYANNRYYSNMVGRFMTPDPSRSNRGPTNPQSWNRYAYTSGDPVNFHDPAGLMEEAICDEDGNECGHGGGDLPNQGWGCDSVYVMTAIDGVQMPGPCDFTPVFFAPPPKQTGTPTCDPAVGLNTGEVAAVQTVLGENSWYLIGHQSYAPGDVSGSPSGPTITSAAVYTEDKDMFSVFANRTQTKGFPSTIGAVATQPGQFLGYNNSPTGGNSQVQCRPVFTGWIVAMQ